MTDAKQTEVLVIGAGPGAGRYSLASLARAFGPTTRPRRDLRAPGRELQ